VLNATVLVALAAPDCACALAPELCRARLVAAACVCACADAAVAATVRVALAMLDWPCAEEHVISTAEARCPPFSGNVLNADPPGRID
jgi:hypothetical protein